MVGVDVDDDHVIEVALVRLLAGVSKQPRGVQFLDRYAATAIGDEIHSVSPGSLSQFIFLDVIARSEATKQSSAAAPSWIASLRSQ
jgi:hypothetical protein